MDLQGKLAVLVSDCSVKMSQFLAPQILFLKEGTDTSQGLGQLGTFFGSLSDVRNPCTGRICETSNNSRY